MVAVATRETRRSDTTALRVLSAVVVLCLGAVVFTLWNSLGGRLDSEVSSEDLRDLSLDTFSPHTFVEAPTGEDGYNDVRVWFFTEGDGSQSAIVNVVYGG